MYVSTREGGTSVFRSPSPKELHEMQWQIGTGGAGRLVKMEQVVPAAPPSQEADTSNGNDITDIDGSRDSPDSLCAPNSRERRPENRRRVWFTNIFGLETVLSLREPPDPKPVPLPEGCVTPHPIFARKFSLVADNQPLPPSLPHDMMPTADIKARRLLADAAVQGLMGPS
ncbi:uncharacterized protein GLRG_08730 [Colletotrichum graminicola M1.001]|uniref:Uncharacterized protein n=1 Tax=Colletotrichum graminicola (strain M1.001 / M2 / FGSC 10212) TaxID=645133 RepID=E3QRG3_COLGM|nr:uncharacterized protein GLRG_08730 [Colletotrichum graminicola M1.001]EFQ33451.1 hypothetical protein GLRG_08730 [Colletotrichum graminicola M1.001]